MPKLIFYRQKRFDGAVRTGIELDDETIAERFEDTQAENDPALLWYIDMRCEDPDIPADPDDAEQWLLDQSMVIRDGFARYAEHLRAGADVDVYSLSWSDFKGLPDGVSMTIACSAARRVDAREMSTRLKEVGENWEANLKSLDVPQEVEDFR